MHNIREYHLHQNIITLDTLLIEQHFIIFLYKILYSLSFSYRKRKIVAHHVMHYSSKRMNVQYYDIGSDHGLPFAVPAASLR